MTTTCGVLIRCNTGEPRLTVANHGFLGTDSVYHPHADVGGVHIGEITERFEALDIALVQLLMASRGVPRTMASNVF